MLNSLIKNNDTDETYRILHIINGDVVLINVDKETCKTFILNLEDINDGLSKGLYEILEEDNFLPIINEECLSKKEKETRDKANKIIEYIHVEPDIYYKEKEGRLFLKQVIYLELVNE